MQPTEDIYQRQLDALWKKANEIGDQNSRILSYLEDDATTGRVGFIRQQQLQEERLKKVEDFQRANAARRTVMLGVGTAIGSGLVWLVVNLEKLAKLIKAFVMHNP